MFKMCCLYQATLYCELYYEMDKIIFHWESWELSNPTIVIIYRANGVRLIGFRIKMNFIIIPAKIDIL